MPVAGDLPRDRVSERRRAVALAHHYRQAERLTIAQVADRLGSSPATIKAYFYDPTGEKARAVAPGLDHNSNGAASAFYRDVLRPLARSTSLLMLHHENKPSEHRGRAEYAATGARAWAHQADRHLTLAATGDKEVKQQDLGNGHTRGTYALELDSGKTRGALKPKLRLSIVTEADALGRVISTEVTVTGERPRRSDYNEALIEQVLSFITSRPVAKLAEIATAAEMPTNDGRLRRTIDTLLERDLIVKAARGEYKASSRVAA
jgi:AraC-like DNA-binding protein